MRSGCGIKDPVEKLTSESREKEKEGSIRRAEEKEKSTVPVLPPNPRGNHQPDDKFVVDSRRDSPIGPIGSALSKAPRCATEYRLGLSIIEGEDRRGARRGVSSPWLRVTFLLEAFPDKFAARRQVERSR